MPRINSVIENSFVPGTRAELTVRGRVPAADANSVRQTPVRALRRCGRRHGLSHRMRVHRWLRRLRLHRGGRRANNLRCWPGRRQRPHPGGISAPRQPGAPGAGLCSGHPASGCRQPLTDRPCTLKVRERSVPPHQSRAQNVLPTAIMLWPNPRLQRPTPSIPAATMPAVSAPPPSCQPWSCQPPP
jgi:hypothetical protein